jgi:hypothetical protein
MGCCFSNPIEEPVIPQSTVSVYSSASSANANYPALVPGSGQAYIAQPYVQQYAATQPYSQQYQVPIGMQPQQLNMSQIQYQHPSNIAYSVPTYPYPTAPPQMPSRTYSQDPSNVI